MLFRVKNFLKEKGLNSEILGYYYSPYLRFKENGIKCSNVRIGPYDRVFKTVKLFCLDAYEYLKTRTVRYIEIEVPTNELEYHSEIGKENLNTEFVKYFCNMTHEKIYLLQKYPSREMMLGCKVCENVISEINLGQFDECELQNYEKLAEKYVEENELEKFAQLYTELYSTDKKKFGYVKNIFRIRRYFEVLRYEYNKTFGEENKYAEEKIKEWIEKFEFPLKKERELVPLFYF